MVPYLFLSDIDGTLVQGSIGMTPGVLAAAQQFRDAGGLLAVCTGRSPIAALPIALELGVNTSCVLYGGAALYDCRRRRLLWSHPFPDAVRSCIAQALERFPSLSVQVFTAEDIYVLRRNEHFNAKGIKAENIGPICTLGEVQGDILKLVLCSNDPEELERCRSCFPAEFCQYAFASRTFVDVVAAGAGKESAMAALSQQLGIPFSHFFCAGDAITDLPMMQLAGVSYAPANALEPVRRAATLVVPQVGEGGMEQAFLDAARKICRF